MEVKIEQDNENALLKRRELIASIDYEGKSTPSRGELEAAIATMKKVDFNCVKVHKLFSDHGRPLGKAWIRIYDKPIAEKIEAQKKKDEKPKEEAKPAEAPAEEKPAEKPTEAPEEKKE
jgi:ribosomal protein S24E